MTKLILFLILTFVSTRSYGQETQDHDITIGAEIGFSHGNLDYHKSDFSDEFLGTYGGVMLGYKPSKSIFTVHTGMRYHDRKITIPRGGLKRFRSDYVTFPVAIRFQLIKIKSVTIHPNIGGELAIRLNPRKSDGVTRSSITLGIGYGLGATYKLKQSQISVNLMRTFTTYSYKLISLSPAGQKADYYYGFSTLEFGISASKHLAFNKKTS